VLCIVKVGTSLFDYSGRLLFCVGVTWRPDVSRWQARLKYNKGKYTSATHKNPELVGYSDRRCACFVSAMDALFSKPKCSNPLLLTGGQGVRRDG
jgi:hypothetical protein